MSQAVQRTEIPGLAVRRGKVRDIYELDDARLLIVATDRISAFDVILNQPIPDKGKVLTRLSVFWFEHLAGQVTSHLERFLDTPEAARRADARLSGFADVLAGRSMIVSKVEVFPVECVVRGYLAGSGWKSYRQTGEVCGIKLPAGLRESDRLPQPIFTPSTKAEAGHDENISMERAKETIGADAAEYLRERSVAVYQAASEHARSRGVIIADTKFEWGRLGDRIILADEVLTPDSSRFWPAESYRPGRPQPSFDKQFVRDFLETCSWDKTPPAPTLPADVIVRTREKYVEAYERLTGRKF